jgi:hypothetical protein
MSQPTAPDPVNPPDERRRALGARAWVAAWPGTGTLVLALVLRAGLGSAAPGDPNANRTALREHVARLKAREPEGFTVVPQAPFVVIGDESPAQVELRATRTVKWAVDKLKQEYFQRDPAEIIDIWLLRDRESYTNHAWRLFGHRPTTPFGYYSAEHRALVMNIATGGGTLVHEIVHPFLRANFPACPPWFNEGLASLYEQSAERNGRIRGLINWRYKGLVEAIKDGRTISFEKLTSLDEGAFYGSTSDAHYGRHYGQARYLCLYLQEHGLLRRFYREFVAKAGEDPTGLHTLQQVLGERDMVEFQKKWERWVLDLRSTWTP